MVQSLERTQAQLGRLPNLSALPESTARKNNGQKRLRYVISLIFKPATGRSCVFKQLVAGTVTVFTVFCCVLRQPVARRCKDDLCVPAMVPASSKN